MPAPQHLLAQWVLTNWTVHRNRRSLHCMFLWIVLLPGSSLALSFSQCWVEPEIEAQHIILQRYHAHLHLHKASGLCHPGHTVWRYLYVHSPIKVHQPREGDWREMADTVVSHIPALKLSQDITNSLISRPQSNPSQLAVCLNSLTVFSSCGRVTRLSCDDTLFHMNYS